jgi:hypothetical protein
MRGNEGKCSHSCMVHARTAMRVKVRDIEERLPG